MAGGQKKVIVRPFGSAPVSGYLPGADFLRDGELQLLDPNGKLISVRMNKIKWIAYVRDFNLQNALDPEHLGKKTFPARPRADGLWVRALFTDGDALEGLAATDLGLLDGLLADGGLFLTPPDTRSNTQRVFVPRSALQGLEMLGLIRPVVKRTRERRDAAMPQPGLFED